MAVQIERMKPKELYAARDRFPVAYIPIGAIEYHGNHLPVGLDTLKSHGILCRVAEEIGGLVAPPVFYGNGGGHGDFDWTWMLDAETVVDIVLTTIHGLEKSGCKVIVVLSGHYPNDQLYPLIHQLHAEKGGPAKLLTLMEYDPYRAAGEAHGDHAAKWETSYMLALEEGLVDMDRIRHDHEGKSIEAFAGPQPTQSGEWWFEKDPAHPWFGIAAAEGNSPLDASKDLGDSAIQCVTSYIQEQVMAALDEIGWHTD